MWWSCGGMVTMMKPDELAFLTTLARERPKPTEAIPYATDIGERLGMHRNRVHYILLKWDK